MCVVSMIGDHFHDKWSQPFNQGYFESVTRAEFLQLQKEVLEMKELLKKAMEYDKKNNEPDCHIEQKVEVLKKVAELFGVDLKDIFKNT